MPRSLRFDDRRDAGRQLAEVVAKLELRDVVVLALPRGGVPVGYEVARRLGAPLHVFVARKVGAPQQPELGVGAIAEGGGRVINEPLVEALGISPTQLAKVEATEQRELLRRVEEYRGGQPLPPLPGHDVVLIDDGLATGVTAEAALRALRAMGPRRLVLAVPTCAEDSAHRLGQIADSVVCVVAPPDFRSVGAWYRQFDQTTDDEVLRLIGLTRPAA